MLSLGMLFRKAIADTISVIQLQLAAVSQTNSNLGMKVTRELLDAAAIADQSGSRAQGPNLLAQQLFAILFGDYVSYYLAMLNGVDPTPVATT